ncbi:MAG: glycosyltransferase family 4 protein [Filifactoraceae bacterium]
MKILLTTDTYEPSVNGVVISVRNLYNELKKNGHDVKVLTLSQDHHNKKEGDIFCARSFNAGKIYPDVRGTIPYESVLIEELLEWKPDIVHSNSEFFTFIYANKIAYELNIPTVHTYHTMYEYYTGYVFKSIKVGRRTVSTIVRRILKNVDAIIAPTLKVKESLESYGLNNNIKIIPTGISLDRFTSKVSIEEINALKEEFKIPESSKVIITIGRLGVEKNVDEIIKNFKLIKGDITDAVLVIVGDGPYKKSLENMVRVNNLEGSVIFTGMVDPKDINKFYKMGDIFVSASNSETQGLTYIEALGSGRPVLCKYDEVLEGIVENGINGYTYHTSEEFIDYVKELFSNVERYEIMSKKASLSVDKYSLENFGRNVEDFYNSVIENYKDENKLMRKPIVMAKKAARGVKKSLRLQSKYIKNLKITK